MNPSDDRPRDDEMEFVHRAESESEPPEAEQGPPTPESADDADGGTAVGATFAVRRRREGPPWVMIGAGVVIALVAAWIFWPQGGGNDIADLGLGENVSILTTDSTVAETPRPAQPRSSDVNLGMEVKPIVPEQPEGQQAERNTREAPARTTQPAAAAATRQKTPPTATKPPVLTPGPAGKWAIQVGAFGSKANADKLAARLRKKGFRVEAYRADTGAGTVWKVWIGYFPTREETVRWLEQHREEVGMPTYITHR